MSTVHSLQNWQPSEYDTIELRETVLGFKESVNTAWKLKNPLTDFMMITYVSQKVMSDVLKGVIDSAHGKIVKDAHQGKKNGIPFNVNPTKNFNTLFESNKKGSDIPVAIYDKVYTIGLDYIQQKRDKAALFNDQKKDYPNDSFIFYSGMNQMDLRKQQLELTVDFIQFLLKNLPVTCQRPFIYSDEDLDFFELKKNQTAPSSAFLSCFDYALLKARESQAKNALLNEELDSFKNLRTWGYRNVECPNIGDLVLYFSDITKAPTHMGIMVEDGLVESKFGINNPNIYIHNLFDVFPHYGGTVVFMRKSPFLLQKD